jgi:hypothetical protein
MAKLTEIADLEKDSEAWRNEPRIPAGQTGGGQWTSGGGGAAALVKPAQDSSHTAEARPERPVLPLDDGVYRPGAGHPFLIPAGGAEEEEEPARRSNGPPPDFTPLYQILPFLQDNPALVIPLAPFDHVLGISGSVEATDQAAVESLYFRLVREIKAINPSFVDQQLVPLSELSWQGRDELIDGLRMQLAAAHYNVRGDIRPLQLETLRFLQERVDKAYAQGVKEFAAGKLPVSLSRAEAIGNYIDPLVRTLS